MDALGRQRQWLVGLAAGLALVLAFFAISPPAFDTPYSSVVEDKHGQLLAASIASDGQWRFPKNSDVPEKFRAALLQFEDQRFAWHPGVDPLAIARAAWSNIAAGRVVSGASTLTMQAVRLSRGNQKSGWWAKAWEAVLALRLEAAHSKSDILTLYAAHAPFGGNVVGLEAAAWRYFGRGAQSLSWAEAALLAVLPNKPGALHLGRERQALQVKRNRLLWRLETTGHFDEPTGQLARLEPLPGAPKALPQHAVHLLAYGKNQRLRTSIDGALQRRVIDVLGRHQQRLLGLLAHNAAVLVADVDTGLVRAYIGNSADISGQEYGAFVDIVRAPRSSGSILKPFLYAGMLDASALLPNQLVMDVPVRMGGFAPKNFDRNHDGAVPAAEALARSLNIPAVWMLREFGVGRFYLLLKDMGLTTLHRRAEDYGLSLILGGAEVSLWDLAGVYASLARMAKGPPQAEESQANDSAAATVTPAFRSLRVSTEAPAQDYAGMLQPGAAYLMLQAMQEVSRPGVENIWRWFAGAQRIAWKTGTSFGFRDAWAVGVTPKYVVAVWVGNSSGEGGAELTGLKAAAPVLFDIFSGLPRSGWFEPRQADLARVETCSHSGMRAGPHCDTVQLEWAPARSADALPCHYCQTIHCVGDCAWRVHASCESLQNMHEKQWFVLPPHMAWFYRKRHANYAPLPPWRADCVTASSGETAMSWVFPKESEGVYVPVELDGSRGEIVFQAAHKDSHRRVYWHLGDEYLGVTQHLHQMALSPPAGSHKIILVDEEGMMLQRRFNVTERSRQ